MKSASIVFPEAQHCEVTEEEIADPGSGEITIQTTVSLISTGTESWCYRGEFDAGTSWAGWVEYPFYLGCSNVGQAVTVGQQVSEFAEGDRVFSITNHRQFAAVAAKAAGATVYGISAARTEASIRSDHSPPLPHRSAAGLPVSPTKTR